MRKQKRQMCVRRMLLFFLACVLICAAPPSAAQAAIMQTAKNSTVQKEKNIHENSYNRDFRRNHKKESEKRWFCDSSCGSE